MSGVHVRVKVGTEDYALPVMMVREVGSVGDIAQLPGVPAAVLGMHNLHGQVVPVLDLGLLLGVSADAPGEKMVIVEDAGVVAALAVTGVIGVEPLGGADEHVEAPLLCGAALVEGALVGVIDLPAVFDSVRAQRA